ncbi:unnamed protein product [Schistosoma margrebowiei]|uniref:Saposin B-type domain-containing protein n=1 Tax=Schistosoma margrebowiei TaxID=48269 RepID=A0AA84ZXL1_9TREM|nr:unnamed protein product [Schistosoma margrebowiei]
MYNQLMLVTIIFIFCIFYTSDAFKITKIEENNCGVRNITWECGFCLSGCSLVHYFVNDVYWRDIYMLGVEKLCAFISSEKIKNICDKYSSKYLPEIWDAIGSIIEPEELCLDFNKCNSTEIKMFTTQKCEAIRSPAAE